MSTQIGRWMSATVAVAVGHGRQSPCDRVRLHLPLPNPKVHRKPRRPQPAGFPECE
jgi:hypothetical protein